jgi:hypothetical protein
MVKCPTCQSDMRCNNAYANILDKSEKEVTVKVERTYYCKSCNTTVTRPDIIKVTLP